MTIIKELASIETATNMLQSCEEFLQHAKARLNEKLPKSLVTYILFCVFGIGSWIAINGVWAEISILVLTTPECATLPAILVVVIQVANIGPLCYTFIKYIFQRCGWKSKQYQLEVGTIFVLVTIGIASCILLSIFWNDTLLIHKNMQSVALILLTFFLALVDCTSSVVFIPFMKHFPVEYMSALYIGEGLSGVLPSAVALTQGFVNNSIGCNYNYTDREALGIRFSPDIHFIILAGLMLLCGLAFLAIITLPTVRKQKINTPNTYSYLENSQSSSVTTEAESSSKKYDIHRKSDIDDPILDQSYSNAQTSESEAETVTPQAETPMIPSRTMGEDVYDVSVCARTPSPQLPIEVPKSILAPGPRPTRFQVKQTNKVRSRSLSSRLVLNRTAHEYQNTFSCKNICRILWMNLTVYTCLAILNFLSNGALSAISSFAFIPYGNDVYHIAINLALFANPIMSLVYAFVSAKSRVITAMSTAIACLLGVYVLVMAILSPQPLLKTELLGKIIIVTVFVVITMLVSYTKLSVAVQLHCNESDKDTALILLGLVTQLGSLLGAVLFFVLVYYTHTFKFS